MSPRKISIHPDFLDTACLERADQLGIQGIANCGLDELGGVIAEHSQKRHDESAAEDVNAYNRNTIFSTEARA